LSKQTGQIKTELNSIKLNDSLPQFSQLPILSQVRQSWLVFVNYGVASFKCTETSDVAFDGLSVIKYTDSHVYPTGAAKNTGQCRALRSTSRSRPPRWPA